jgi:iron complex outermembrane receptor protein
MTRHQSPPAIRPSRRERRALATAIAVALGTAAPAIAADAPSAGLEEVVVTANRRQQSVIDVPYNISAISGSALENAGVRSLSDMTRVLPGLTIPDLGARASSSNSLIIIRGLNVNDPVNSAYLPWGSVPTVSTYVDDVPIYVNLKLTDMQRIEVLRGPQGTLYGSGAVGGTVKLVHNAPDPARFYASVSTEGAKTTHAGDPSYSLDAVLNVPLAERLAFRLSAGYDKAAGFIDALNEVVLTGNQQPVLANPADPLGSGPVYRTRSHVDDARSFYARAALKWQATEALTAEFAHHRQDDHSNGFSHQTQGFSYQTQVLIPNEPEHRTVDLDSLTLTGDLGFATVTSSSSFSAMSVDNTYDESQFVTGYDSVTPLLYGHYPRITSPFFTTSRDTNFTQEIRLVSKEGGGWDYAVGAFFQHQTEHLLQRESVPGFAAWSELAGSADAANTALGLPPGSGYANFGDFLQQYYGGTRPSALTPVDTNFTYLRLSGLKDKALYGELTRHITPKWQVTGGARIFWQDFAQSLYSTIPYGGPVYSTLPVPDAMGTTIVDRAQSFHNHTFKLNTSYALSKETRVYATYSEGFRRGGINAVPVGNCIFCEAESLVPYKSDTVRNYELGIKGNVAHWLRFSAAVYRVDWNDIQIQVFGQAGDPAVVNGNTARSEGVELELDARLGGGFTATVGYGYTDPKITSDFKVMEHVGWSDTDVQLVAGQSGDRLPYVPKQTLTGDLDYSHPFGPSLSFDAHLQAAYRSSVTTQLNDTVLGYQTLGGFTTVTASAGLGFGPAWHVRVFGQNLTNQRGVTSAGPLYRFNDDPRYRIENVMRPRTVGIGIDYRFE